MRGKYNTVLGSLLLAGAALAAPCPPAIPAIAAKVAELRDVPAPFSPPCRLIAPGALRAALDHKLHRDLPVAPELFIEALTRLGFVTGEPAAIYNRLLDFYASQVLGYYEPDGDEMVVVDTPAAGRAEGALVWAHELEHAAQEHRFHLPSRLLAMRGDSDEQRAASAIAEGEAMLVMYVLNAPGVGAQGLELAETAVRQQARELAPPGVPEYFVADLAFPYTAGFAAVLRAYRAGGWPAVDRLLAHPPTSTAALLHPDRPGVPGSVPAAYVASRSRRVAGGLHRLRGRVGARVPARAAARRWGSRCPRRRLGRRPVAAGAGPRQARPLGRGLAPRLSHRPGAPEPRGGDAAHPPRALRTPGAARAAAVHLGWCGADP